ncbi:ANTAR domain-containing protein [Geodermatophilus sp. SYSU D01045]
MQATTRRPIRTPVAQQEDQDTMTVDPSGEVPAAPVHRLAVLAELDQLHARVRSAEDRAANLEQALATNRQIGIAIGILMCQRQLTADQAFAMLTTHSQHSNVKVRVLAETVIYTGSP